MERLDRETLLKEVVKTLIEEGGEATIPRLYYRLQSRIGLSYHEFAEAVKGSGRFAITRPHGWEDDLVSLKPSESDRRLENVEGGGALNLLESSLARAGGASAENEPLWA